MAKQVFLMDLPKENKRKRLMVCDDGGFQPFSKRKERNVLVDVCEWQRVTRWV